MATQPHPATRAAAADGPAATPPLPYADVVVDVPTDVPGDTFTYAVPPYLDIQPGQLVRVPFGRRNAHGVVVRLHDQLRLDYAKTIHSTVHPEPLLTATQMELGQWISDYYRTSLFEAMAPMLPPGLRVPTQSVVRAVQGVPTPQGLSDAAQRLLSYLRNHPNGGQLPALARLLGPWVPSAVRALVEAGMAERGWSAPTPRDHPPLRQQLRAVAEAATTIEWALAHETKAPKQSALARQLANHTTTAYLASQARRDFGPSAVASLIKRGIARIHAEPEQPKTQRHAQPPDKALLPTEAQTVALEQVRQVLDDPNCQPRVLLLEGVTGSGKTEVYLQALAHCLAQGLGGLVLVPELSLAPQTLERFSARFPGKVVGLHSGLSPRAQSEEWWRVLRGDYEVVVGSRSTVFAPLRNLGLIILDEEHEWTYKQVDGQPRYHARDVAEQLAQLTNAVVLLGSATPDVISSHRARQGAYQQLTLPRRIQASGAPAPLASVEVVDMREELRSGNRSPFSRTLQSALSACMDAGQQAILFLNRRGSAGVVQCRDCGFVLRCWQCSSPYTYHGNDTLICHHCNRRRKVPRTCPQCRGPNIRYLGLGTRRVVEEVEHLLPKARVLRWDRDAATTIKAHQELLDRFASGDSDVLVGTQMIAKGLHVPAVTLVSAVLADVGLHVPDYRSGERTFQVLCQVAGRAGRGSEAGRVIIQTFVPDHYAIQAAAAQDYGEFYEKELHFRKAQRYPPLGKLIRLAFGHRNEATAQGEAQRMAASLKRAAREWGFSRTSIIGPAPAYPPRLRGIWRWHILLRADNPRLLLDKVRLPPNWRVDVDPVSTV